MTYELYYSNGGHGGPYPNLVEAYKRAIDLLKGCKSKWPQIEVRPRTSDIQGGYGEKHKNSLYVKKPNKSINELQLAAIFAGLVTLNNKYFYGCKTAWATHYLNKINNVFEITSQTIWDEPEVAEAYRLTREIYDQLTKIGA